MTEIVRKMYFRTFPGKNIIFGMLNNPLGSERFSNTAVYERKKFYYLQSSKPHKIRNIHPVKLKLHTIDQKFNADVENGVKWGKKF